MCRQLSKKRQYASLWSEGIRDTTTPCRRAVYHAKKGRDYGSGRHFEGALGCSAGGGLPLRERCYVAWQQLCGTEHGGTHVNDDRYRMFHVTQC